MTRAHVKSARDLHGALAAPPDVVGGLADPLPALLGYQVRPPFMGHVNGMHLKLLLT